MSGLRGRTWRTTLVVVLVVLVAGVLIALRLWPDDRTHVVPVDAAVRNYRASTVPADTAPITIPPTATAPTPTAPTPTTTPAPTGSSAPAADDGTISTGAATTIDTTDASGRPATTGVATRPVLAATGVYRYATEGWEDIDALDGARHDYPAETTITITAEECGIRVRWDALRERRDEWLMCPTERGIELQADAIQYHEFFQQPELERLECDRGVIVAPIGESPEEPVVQSCRLGDDPWTATWSVIGRTTRPVAGNDVAVWHVRMTVDDDDEFWEHTTIDWFFDDHGLPVAVLSDKESNSPSPIGDVRYREHYELSAVSVTPLR